ncbi:MAG: FecR family protein [Agriterribacter sp.]
MIERLRYLYERYKGQTATLSEQRELSDLLEQAANSEQLRIWIGEDMETEEPVHQISEHEAETVFARVVQRASGNDNQRNAFPGILHFFKLRPVRYAAAAAVIVAVGIYFFRGEKQSTEIVAKQTATAVPVIKPGGNKALLTLADGSTITLDSAANGNLAEQGGVSVVKLANGQLMYRAADTKSTEPIFNTLSTPRGGQYQLQLPDGSKVWLNASSSITYPASFSDSERKVVMSGEAYFEVVKNPSKPFKVYMRGNDGQVNEHHVEVLGTHFNVNNYQDEPAAVVTLLEGAVKIDNSSLKPGEAYSKGGVSKVNAEEAIAWKNGYFQFEQADIKAVMRQIARWYDVDVRYEGNIPERKFGGDILRDSELADVLKGLEVSQVHFRMEGRNLIITP